MTPKFELNSINAIDMLQPTMAQSSLSTQPASKGQTAASFSQTLDKAQRVTVSTDNRQVGSSKPPLNRWRSLNFLAAHAAPRINRPWLHPDLNRSLETTALNLPNIFDTLPRNSLIKESMRSQFITQPTTAVQPSAALLSNTQPLTLADYPRPPADNGQGIHWIPTVSQTPEVVDRFVNEAVSMGMKWVLFLNEGTDIGANDYLVKQLTKAGIEPIMRIYTPGLTPIEGNIKKMVQHYKKLGVDYFQIYNEPNLMVETGGRYPNVDQYLNLWTAAAQQVIEGEGCPALAPLALKGKWMTAAFCNKPWLVLKNAV